MTRRGPVLSLGTARLLASGDRPAAGRVLDAASDAGFAMVDASPEGGTLFVFSLN